MKIIKLEKKKKSFESNFMYYSEEELELPKRRRQINHIPQRKLQILTVVA